MRGQRGFTTAELITVIVIAGLLAAIAVPRFVGRDSFASRGFSDEAISIVRHAQKTAIAWRRPVFVCVTADAVSAGAAAGCTPPLLSAPAPAGVTLSPAAFSFDGLGRPSAGVTIALTSTIPGDPARQIVVEAETGYVHP
ncbi:MAG TPA: type II secretion system protein [Burkholderiales bacterium]|nr:type II secretion system protein [Burkholderiales bacterium]